MTSVEAARVQVSHREGKEAMNENLRSGGRVSEQLAALLDVLVSTGAAGDPREPFTNRHDFECAYTCGIGPCDCRPS
jgi:hypothetical protein